MVATAERRWDLLLCVGLAAGAALIHVSATVDHARYALLFSVFFACLVAAQLAWAAALLITPSGGVLRAGLLLNAGVVAVWAFTRTLGPPLGPEPWHPEAVGVLDALATIDELAIVALLCGLLRPALRLSAPLLVALSLMAFEMGTHAG